MLLLPLADYTVRYAIEARAYMLLLGVSAIALVCWQSTVDRRSRLAPLGLACSVAAALLLHVWAILLPLALTAGEAVEFLRTRRLRWRVIGPLIAAAPALGVYLILLRASKTVIFGGPAYAPTPDKLYAAFRSDVPRPRVVVAVVAATLVAGWWARRGALEKADTTRPPPRGVRRFRRPVRVASRAISTDCQRRRVHDALRRFRAAGDGRSDWRVAFSASPEAGDSRARARRLWHSWASGCTFPPRNRPPAVRARRSKV